MTRCMFGCRATAATPPLAARAWAGCGVEGRQGEPFRFEMPAGRFEFDGEGFVRSPAAAAGWASVSRTCRRSWPATSA